MPAGRLLALDADPNALAYARQRLSAWAERIEFVHSNFVHITRVAEEKGFAPCDGILIDLGWSSLQIDDASRGLSFHLEGPLDMRYDTSQGVAASELLDSLDEAEIADLLWRFGEERQSRRIARAIAASRPLRTTTQLAELVERVIGRPEKIHPATRTFQALRIAVNDELGVLQQTLEQLPALLKPGGVLAIIAFHSLEDRMVKQYLAREASDCICPPDGPPVCTCGHRAQLKLQPRGAIMPGPAEVAANPRSRSARLRVAVRLAPAAADR
jgi:16S rRNA (cytosine1402-N4)-methyltransferase